MIDNNILLYVFITIFFAYIIFFNIKEKLDNTDISSYTEEQLRLAINKSIRSRQTLETLLKIEDPPEFIKRRIGELHDDIKNGDSAKEVLISRNIYV
jgi:hypothetical protein